MDEDSHLSRYGLHPTAEQLVEVRRILGDETTKEARGQGDGNTLLMHLCCVQLFNQGCLGDVLRIWRAKRASMDAYTSIDVQLLCGQGLGETKAYLRSIPGAEASAALSRIEAGEREPYPDFEAFSPTAQTAEYERYYGVD
ncbi:MAG: hypothetical protein ACPG4T_00605 [Nannocystaceae bacterium]